MNYHNTHNVIILTLFHNACEHVFTMQQHQTLYDFAMLIAHKLKLNISEYNLIYNNKPVNITNTAITQLIGDNHTPLFMLRNKHYTKYINNSNSNNNDKYDIYVVIECFPSMNDLSERISLFMKNVNDNENEYDIESKYNWCKVMFSNRQTAFAFVQYLNTLKLHNKLYYKLRIKICNCTFISKCALQQHQRKLNQSRSAIDMSSSNNKRITAVNTSINSINSSNLPSIRSSSPYLSGDDYHRIEMKINKQKWLTKRGFISSVGNSNSANRDIKNYVSETPSQSPLLHKFRSINKQKWMNYKGFV